MAGLISYKTSALREEWQAGSIDPRLKFILHAVSDYVGGIKITQLTRTTEENARVGGHPKSKHLSGQAADFVPPIAQFDQAGWRYQVKAFIDKHTDGIDCVIRAHGTAPHVHIEIDPKHPFVDVVLTV